MKLDDIIKEEIDPRLFKEEIELLNEGFVGFVGLTLILFVPILAIYT
jgi:hypothetical protein